MSKKGKKNGRKRALTNLALATATIDLIIHLIDLINRIMD